MLVLVLVVFNNEVLLTAEVQVEGSKVATMVFLRLVSIYDNKLASRVIMADNLFGV